MFRKITILIPVFFLCLGLDNCKSPMAPEEPEPNYEYRYNVEVIYTRVEAVDYPESEDWTWLDYWLYDPALLPEGMWYDQGVMEMDKIGEGEFRCYLDRVFIQTSGQPDQHHVFVSDHRIQCWTGRKIDIRGTYDREVRTGLVGCTSLWFRMSKN